MTPVFWVKRIDGTRGMYRLHTHRCKVLMRSQYARASLVRLRHDGVLVMDGDYSLPVHSSEIGQPCRSCKAAYPRAGADG